MNTHTTTQLVWSIGEETVERHVTVEPSGYSSSQRNQEFTMADAWARPAANVHTDLEVGAHVVPMRTLATVPDTPPGVRSWVPLSTPRALPVAWETA